MEEYLAREGKTLEDYKRMVQPAVWEQTAVCIAGDHVITAERLTLAPERLQRYYARYAAGSKISVEEAKSRANEEILIEDMLQKDALNLVHSLAFAETREVAELPQEI